MKKAIKNIIEYALYTMYFMMTMLYFKKNKRIVFMSYPDATDNSWHLYKYALTHLAGYEMVWLVSKVSPQLNDKILLCNQNLHSNTVAVVKKWSLRGLHNFIGAQVVFHTHGTYFFVKAAFNSPTLVNLWHGMPIKAIAALDGKTGSNVCYSHYSIATSEPYREIIAQAFKLPLERVLPTGLPRNDVLYTGVSAGQKKKILKAFSGDRELDIVIWLPTYRVSAVGDIRVDGQHASFLDDLDPDFLHETNQLFANTNRMLVIKLHPMDAMHIASGEYSFSNIKFYDAAAWQEKNLELYEVISVSHGLISDFSSVMIDCLSTAISIGFIKSSQSNYDRTLVIPIADLEACVFSIKKPEDIINMINKKPSVKNNDKALGKLSFFNSFGGHASEKIVAQFLK